MNSEELDVTSDEDRERRLALNEALARDVNELVDQVASGWFAPDELVEFRCECVRASCAERLTLTREEYASVRTDPLTFAVYPGHESLDVEEVVAHGEAAGEIVRVARERGIDLIVISSHGRTGWGRMLFGSTAESVVRHAHCPVLVVKPKGSDE